MRPLHDQAPPRVTRAALRPPAALQRTVQFKLGGEMSGYTLRAMSPEERVWVGRRGRAPLDPDTRYSLLDLIPPLFFAGCLSAVLSIPLVFVARIWRAVPLKPVGLSLLVCAYVVMVVV